MKILLTIVCVIGLLENNCYARIGETLAQCDKRYGVRITDVGKIKKYYFLVIKYRNRNYDIKINDYVKINNSGEVDLRDLYGNSCFFYRSLNFITMVEFYDKKAERITFFKLNESDSMENQQILSNDILKLLLMANLGKVEWTNKNSDRWEEVSASGDTFLNDENLFLTITSFDYYLREVARSENFIKQEKEILGKF